MPWLRSLGISSIPVVIFLSVFIAVLAIGLGTRGLRDVRSKRQKQRTIVSFNKFVETCKELSYSPIGETQKVNLDLNGDKIEIHGRILRLKVDGETRKVEKSPLPLEREKTGKTSIESGVYIVDIQKKYERERLVLEVSRASR